MVGEQAHETRHIFTHTNNILCFLPLSVYLPGPCVSEHMFSRYKFGKFGKMRVSAAVSFIVLYTSHTSPFSEP